MFDLVRNNKKFIQIVLALIVLPFALWGVDSYVSGGARDEIASVGDASISTAEFQNALREQQERLRSQPGGGISPEMLESPELRRAVLQELVNQRLLRLFANESRMRVSDELLVNYITSVPSLQDESGKFSRERYEALVAAQGMSVEMFEARVRDELLMQHAMMAASNGLMTGKAPVDGWLAAQLEERQMREAAVSIDQFTRQAAKPGVEAIATYYETHRNKFAKPEQVKLEYVVLSQAKLTETAKLADADIEAWYRSNQARYTQPEERQASHILIRLDKNASEADAKAATAKAEKLHQQLKTNPADFAKLAKEHSQDPGSAAKGGDLGFFGRGMMVKPFEEAAFALAKDELSAVVRSDFGLHIIKLTGIKPEQQRALAEVRNEIARELRRQAGSKQYAEAAEAFSNIVYEQPDSLQPAAEKFGLTVQKTDWMTRGDQMTPPLTHPKLIQAVFSEEAIQRQRNTEAIEVGDNTLVAARVVEHRPAEVEPLEAVKPAIEAALLREAALAQAQAKGAELLAKLQKGESVDLKWSNVRNILRMHAPTLSDEARSAVYAVPADKLPAYVGVKVPGGFSLYRVEQIKPFDPATEQAEARGRATALRQQYTQTIAQEEVLGWMAALRQRYPVKIVAAKLESK